MLCCPCLLSQDELELRLINREIEKILKEDKKKAKRQIKILLLGSGESGKSTFIKQMRIIHGNGFSVDEKKFQYTKLVVQNIFSAIQSLIKAMDALKISYDKPEHIDLSNLLNGDTSELTLKNPHLNAIKILWTDSGIQQCYNNRNQFQIIDHAKYFLDKIDEISAPDYCPSDEDILRSRSATTGILEYSFDVLPFTMRIIDVGGQRSERKKWLHCFDNVQLIIFLVAISEYDQTLRESEKQNRMIESRALFQTIINSDWFRKAAFVLFLNKIDVLDEKIKNSHIVDYFPEYAGEKGDADAARNFFKKMFTGVSQDKSMVIYTHFTCATDTDNIKRVSSAVRDMIMVKLLRNFHLS